MPDEFYDYIDSNSFSVFEKVYEFPYLKLGVSYRGAYKFIQLTYYELE